MEKPGSLTVLTILNFILGGWGVLASIGSLLMTLFTDVMSAVPGMPDSPIYRAWTMGVTFVSIFASGALLVAGYGLHKEQLWGRKLSLIYAVYTLVVGVLSAIMALVFFVLPMLRELDMSRPEAAGAIGGAIGGVIGSLFALIYPLVLLYFLTRPHVVAYLKAKSRAEAAPPPLQM